MAGREATVEDLYRVDGKAELVGGELILMSPTGGFPGFAGGEIFASLREYGRRTKAGYALPDNVGFLVRLPNRRSFSPDAAFTREAVLTGKFIEGAPVFAAEVRSEDDYGPAAELVPLLALAMAFQALVGLLVYFHVAIASRAYVLVLAGVAIETALIAWLHETPQQIAAILAAGMLLEHMGQKTAADRIEAAVKKVLESDALPSIDASSGVPTDKVGDMVVAKL
jgi:hypothetical protein